jgi:hypothetical protein
MWAQVVSWKKKSAKRSFRLKSSIEVMRVHFSLAWGGPEVKRGVMLNQGSDRSG